MCSCYLSFLQELYGSVISSSKRRRFWDLGFRYLLILMVLRFIQCCSCNSSLRTLWGISGMSVRLSDYG
jgi:hypothetical protein